MEMFESLELQAKVFGRAEYNHPAFGIIEVVYFDGLIEARSDNKELRYYWKGSPCDRDMAIAVLNGFHKK